MRRGRDSSKFVETSLPPDRLIREKFVMRTPESSSVQEAQVDGKKSERRERETIEDAEYSWSVTKLS